MSGKKFHQVSTQHVKGGNTKDQTPWLCCLCQELGSCLLLIGKVRVKYMDVSNDLMESCVCVWIVFQSSGISKTDGIQVDPQY